MATEQIPVRHIEDTRKDLDAAGSFSIREIQELLGGRDLQQAIHRHDFYFIMVLQKGRGTHEVDFVSYDICDRCIFIMRPGQVHKLSMKKGSRGYLMQFKPEFYSPRDKEAGELLRSVSHKTFCRIDEDAFVKLTAVLGNIYQEFINKRERYTDIIKANLGIFFIELIRNRQQSGEVNAKATTYQQQRLEEFLGLLEANVSGHKEVPYYADKLNLSPFQLNAITKKLLNKTCSEVINDYVILEGKRHLLATANQVNQIAHLLGYEDPSYFIRFFKKHTGFSPEAFRHNFR